MKKLMIISVVAAAVLILVAAFSLLGKPVLHNKAQWNKETKTLNSK